MFGLVVECSDQWSGAQTSGLMFGPVVECSDQWSGARTGGRVLGPVVWCLDWWSGARTCGLVLGLVVAASWRRRCERGMRARLQPPGNLERPTASKGSGMVTVNVSVLCWCA